MKTADYDRTARFASPDKLLKDMKESVEKMLDARVSIRNVHLALGEVANDATGTIFKDNYNDPESRKVSKTLYDLDWAIGEAFHAVEHLERELRKKLIK
jgi:hypothetical protein